MPELLTFVARIKARPGQEAALKETLLSLIKPTHAETGCVQYDLHQSSEDPALFLFYENWTGEAALSAHLQSPHVQKALAAAGPFLAAPPEFLKLKRLNPPKAAK